MEHLKRYIVHHFEQLFVLSVLVVTAAINYYIPYKVAFLNFYFLPIILGGYYLGRRQAVLGAFFCLLAVGVYVYLYPKAFVVEADDAVLFAQVAVWGGFLILAGAVVGGLRERLAERIDAVESLNAQLREKGEALEEANLNLKEYSDDLEAKVVERTRELEESRNAIDGMKRKVENALYATMDPAVVNLMIEGQLRNEKREISVLFSDLVAFTSYSEKNPPEVVIGELNRYLRDMEPIIHAYKGHIDKYMGDGIMCEFGAPINSITHRTMAVVAGHKLQRKLDELDYPWRMRIGIASGSAFTGLIGFKRQTYTAIGDVVNLASRLETNCTPGRLLIDRHTYDGVRDFVEAERKREAGDADPADAAREMELEELLERLRESPEEASLLHRAALLHLALNEPADALEKLERALALDPDSTELRLAYADAGIKLKQGQSGIRVKGKSRRIEAYEVTGLKDPLTNRDKIPAGLLQRYRDAVELINIPDDLTLPVEVLEDAVGHSRVVAFLSYVLAGRLGLPETERRTILSAAFLADIGKEMVPQHILNQPGGLSAADFEIIKQHPAESGRMLRKMGYEEPKMIDIVSHAHEHLNGSGYPAGLAGEAIPMGSRIVAVADAYDALTSRRAYREPWARRAAVDEIKRDAAAGIYDEAVVGQLEQVLLEV